MFVCFFIKTFRYGVSEAIIPLIATSSSPLFTRNSSEQLKGILVSETTYRKAILINNGLEEGRTHRDSNSEHRTERPIGYHYTLGPFL